MTAILLNLLILAWIGSEIALVLRRKPGESDARAARGSAASILLVIGVSMAVALSSQSFDLPRLPGRASHHALAGIAVLIVGLAIRRSAIRSLGSFFNVEVAVRSDQRVVRHGLYRWLRHPSYTGLLLCFLAIGIAVGNWVALAAMTVPVTAVILHRIRVEEAFLRATLGEEYERYCVETRRLLPGIY